MQIRNKVFCFSGFWSAQKSSHNCACNNFLTQQQEIWIFFCFLYLIIGFVLRWKTPISKFTLFVGAAQLHVLQAIKPANLFTQIKPAICNLALFRCIRNRTFNSTVVLGFELEAGWEGTLKRSAVWTQDITPEWENVMWRVYEYETGLQSRHTKVFCVADIISFNP